MNRIITLIFLISISILSCNSTKFVNAAEIDSYKTEYNAEYFPQRNGDTSVSLTVKVTQVRSDISIKQFTLIFPESFPIEDIKILSDKSVNPQINYKNGTEVIFNLPEEDGGKNTSTIFRLEYTQKNSFKKSGSIYEFMAPALSTKKNSSIQAILHIPPFLKEKPSIIKPKPTNVNSSEIIWDNVGSSTIYSLFGESQSYQFTLKYHLENTGLSRKVMEIALPPETLYQHIYINNINEDPVSSRIDDDGNFLTSFIVNPHSKKTISVDGAVKVFTKNQDDMLPFVRQNIKTQKQTLLQKSHFWNLGQMGSDDVVKNLKSVEEIFNAVVNTLDYRYEKIEDRQRLGAREALKNRSNAVCTEYADLFVSLAREKGILTREIEGYGFSSDSHLRPLSLVSDVLHAWVEYYDEKSEKWIQLDPTWEDTSKIDYFSSFDVSHITFAIHGRNDTYPLPAGMYKVENTKDISIIPIDSFPMEVTDVLIDTNIAKRILKGRTYSAILTIENKGNTFVKNRKITIKSDAISVLTNSIPVLLLAPGEKREIPIKYYASGDVGSAQISFFFEDSQILQKSVIIKSFGLDITTSAIGIIIGALTLTLFIVIRLKKQ